MVSFNPAVGPGSTSAMGDGTSPNPSNQSNLLIKIMKVALPLILGIIFTGAATLFYLTGLLIPAIIVTGASLASCALTGVMLASVLRNKKKRAVKEQFMQCVSELLKDFQIRRIDAINQTLEFALSGSSDHKLVRDTFFNELDQMKSKIDPITGCPLFLDREVEAIRSAYDQIFKEIALPGAYITPDNRSFPPIAVRNATQYPKQAILKPFQNKTSLAIVKNTFNTSGKHRSVYDAIESYPSEEDAIDVYLSKAGFLNWRNQATNDQFNLHDMQFQNLALKLLKGYSNEEIYKMYSEKSNEAIYHLIRARTLVIATRSEIDWDGNDLSQWDGRNIDRIRAAGQSKMEEMIDHQKSLTLYDWGGIIGQDGKLGGVGVTGRATNSYRTKIHIWEESSEIALTKLIEKSISPDKICVPNFANAHHIGGGFEIGVTDAQEEHVTTFGDHLGVLYQLGSKGADGRMQYDHGFHLPPGGGIMHKVTYFHKNAPTHTWSNTVAFADFRNCENSEYDDFASDIPTSTRSPSSRYMDRIKLDIRGFLRNAKQHDIEYVITGASGCGAFQHPPKAEAQAWKQVLKEPEFKGQFKEVIFSILPDKAGKNIPAFEVAFGIEAS